MLLRFPILSLLSSYKSINFPLRPHFLHFISLRKEGVFIEKKEVHPFFSFLRSPRNFFQVFLKKCKKTLDWQKRKYTRC